MTALLLDNLAAYSVHLVVVAASVALLARIGRARHPKAQLALWEGALGLAAVTPVAGLAAAGTAAEPGPLALRLGLQAIATAPGIPVGIRWVDVVGFVFVSGALGRIAWVAIGCLRIRRWTQRALPIDVRAVCGHPLDAGSCDRVASPVTVGWLRPVVLVPASFLGLPVCIQRAVLEHEWRHVQRRDPLRQLVGEVWRALLWFHPAAWFLLSRAELAREMCLDHETVHATGDRRAYAQALLQYAGSTPSLPAPAFVRRSHLHQRVTALAEETHPMSDTHRRLAVVLLLGAVATATASAAAGIPMAGWTVGGRPAAQDEAPLSPGPGVQMPRVIHEVRADYTPEALQAKIQGVILLSVVAETDGTAGRVRVAQSLDQTYGLDQAAVDAVSQWRFEPGRKDGRPVPVQVAIEMVFTLRP